MILSVRSMFSAGWKGGTYLSLGETNTVLCLLDGNTVFEQEGRLPKPTS